MYTGYKNNSSINKSISSVNTRTFGGTFGESQLESLQREVDNYTRKLQQQKRRYFNAQQAEKNVMLDLNQIRKEYEAEKQKLDQFKKDSANSETSMLHAKIKNLEANLEKAINVFDDTLAQNNKLKAEIDMLRRQKKNFIQIHTSLEDQIQRSEQESAKRLEAIEEKKKKTQMLKKQIINIKQRNTQEKDNCIKEFETMQKNYIADKEMRELAKLSDKSQKSQSVDTQPILKMRLKKLIAKNKEKVKVIDQYQKNIKQIQQAFEQIKQGSGISDLEQITNTFIKSEEQNYSLYNYVDILSQNIDSLEEQNRELQRKIQRQKTDNEQRKKILSGTPEEERRKIEVRNLVRQKQKVVDELSELVTRIQPDLESTLLLLARSKYNDDPKKLYDYELGFNMSDRNIEQYLSDLQKYINILVETRNELPQPSAKTTLNSEGKEQQRTFNAPVYADEQKEDKEMMGEEDLKKFAEEYIDKKKARLKD